MPLLPRNDSEAAGTLAVVFFIVGAIILVLIIILVLLFLKKRRSARNKTFIPRLERSRGGNYGKLEEDEEQAWSADMGEQERGKGTYAPKYKKEDGPSFVSSAGSEMRPKSGQSVRHYGHGRYGWEHDGLVSWRSATKKGTSHLFRRTAADESVVAARPISPLLLPNALKHTTRSADYHKYNYKCTITRHRPCVFRYRHAQRHDRISPSSSLGRLSLCAPLVFRTPAENNRAAVLAYTASGLSDQVAELGIIKAHIVLTPRFVTLVLGHLRRGVSSGHLRHGVGSEATRGRRVTVGSRNSALKLSDAFARHSPSPNRRPSPPERTTPQMSTTFQNVLPGNAEDIPNWAFVVILGVPLALLVLALLVLVKIKSQVRSTKKGPLARRVHKLRKQTEELQTQNQILRDAQARLQEQFDAFRAQARAHGTPRSASGRPSQ
ncbi:uncharacterized protein M421DRAFT_94336 [Didymella exigua CBS 183.55]|uniref:Uncharacterized protein n=1 Tax=Didymella exigua CBS 183.55 TaxID=1150837 RepID=A0A6A5RFK2_9PLEO|nr:uncharacterized protein M421DRAFT_94336 [Didymella exigua CBS 183.55]KAF1925958.1 hypothetical protein M421DRAFT_94336 [Didymella exigua CBS 183.55]